MSDEQIRVETLRKVDGVAAVLAAQGFAEMFEKGLAPGRAITFSKSDACMLASVANGHDRVAAGVMTFSAVPDEAIWVGQSFVLPEHRGKGVHNAMWNELVAWATNNGFNRIEAITHTRNDAMRAVAKRQGRAEAGVLLTFDL